MSLSSQHPASSLSVQKFIAHIQQCSVPQPSFLLQSSCFEQRSEAINHFSSISDDHESKKETQTGTKTTQNGVYLQRHPLEKHNLNSIVLDATSFYLIEVNKLDAFWWAFTHAIHSDFQQFSAKEQEEFIMAYKADLLETLGNISEKHSIESMRQYILNPSNAGGRMHFEHFLSEQKCVNIMVLDLSSHTFRLCAPIQLGVPFITLFHTSIDCWGAILSYDFQKHFSIEIELIADQFTESEYNEFVHIPSFS